MKKNTKLTSKATGSQFMITDTNSDYGTFTVQPLSPKGLVHYFATHEILDEDQINSRFNINN